MENNEVRYCRVCGLDQYPDLPWGEDGTNPTHNICECCGVEFGYDDDGYHGCMMRRAHWIKVEHCKWFDPKLKPANWDIAAQIRNVPQVYKGQDDEQLVEAYLQRTT